MDDVLSLRRPEFFNRRLLTCPHRQINSTQVKLSSATNSWSKAKGMEHLKQRRGQHLPGLRHLKPVQYTPVCAVRLDDKLSDQLMNP